MSKAETDVANLIKDGPV